MQHQRKQKWKFVKVVGHKGVMMDFSNKPTYYNGEVIFDEDIENAMTQGFKVKPLSLGLSIVLGEIEGVKWKISRVVNHKKELNE